MGVINWVSLYFDNKIDLKPEDKTKMLGKQAIRDLSLKEVRRIATLGDNKEVNSILSVYASYQFNKNKNPLTEAEKERIINILFDASGDKQFSFACNVINNTRSSNHQNIIESVSLVAGATHDFQSEFSSYIALDSLMQRHDSFIRIVRILTLLDKDKAISFYDYIKMLEEPSKDTRELSRLVSEKLKEYETLMGIKPNSIYSADGDSCGGLPSARSKHRSKK